MTNPKIQKKMAEIANIPFYLEFDVLSSFKTKLLIRDFCKDYSIFEVIYM